MYVCIKCTKQAYLCIIKMYACIKCIYLFMYVSYVSKFLISFRKSLVHQALSGRLCRSADNVYIEFPFNDFKEFIPLRYACMPVCLSVPYSYGVLIRLLLLAERVPQDRRMYSSIRIEHFVNDFMEKDCFCCMCSSSIRNNAFASQFLLFLAFLPSLQQTGQDYSSLQVRLIRAICQSRTIKQLLYKLQAN